MRWQGTTFGFMTPQIFVDGPVDMDVVRTVAQRAEAAGCDSLWTQSQLVGGADVLEPLTLLSYVAAVTERVKLGTSVLVVPEHTPVQLAKQISSLDNCSRGRTIVGLGIGVPHLLLDMEGFDMDRPVRRLLEAVDIMRALWTTDPATVEGEIWRLRDVSMNPKPVQRPHPPLWLGGHHPSALRRSARYGDGWMGGGMGSREEFRQLVAGLRQGLEEAGRSEDDFTIAKRLYVAVEDDRKEAERHLIERFTTYSRRPERATEVTVYGTADDVAAGIDEIVDAGAQLIVLNPLYDFVNQQEAVLELIR